jgi:hypothetical protein
MGTVAGREEAARDEIILRGWVTQMGDIMSRAGRGAIRLWSFTASQPDAYITQYSLQYSPRDH